MNKYDSKDFKNKLDRMYNILNVNNYRDEVEKVEYEFIQPLDVDKVKAHMFSKYWSAAHE